MCALKISLFGCLRVMVADDCSPVKATPISQALLAYLLLQPHRLCAREQVMEALWGDQSYQSARKCLNSTVWRLRRTLEPDDQRGAYLITTDSGELGFNWASDYWLDIECFAAQIEPLLRKPVGTLHAEEVAVVERTLRLYQGELLEGFYTDWALLARERLRRLYLNGLAHLMHYYGANASFDKGLACGQQILDLDPLREEIHRTMMELYLHNGQRALAIRQYERCCDVLERELDVPPMAETQLLFQQLMTQKSAHNSTPIATVASPAAASIAPVSPPADHTQALHALHLAMQRFEEARAQLQQAIHLVERYSITAE